MLKIILITVFGFVCANAVGQTKYYNMLEELVRADGSTAHYRLNYILRKEFSRVVGANSNGAIGNYVGLSSKDKTLSFAYNWVRENGVLDFNCSAGINDNIAGIIAENKFKTDVKLGIKYHRYLGVEKFNIDYDGIKTMQRKLDELKIDRTRKRNSAKGELEKLKKNIAKKELAHKALLKKRKLLIAGEGEVGLDKKKKEYLDNLKKATEIEIASLKIDLANVKSIIATRMAALKKKRAAKTPKYNSRQFQLDSLKILRLEMVFADSLKATKKRRLEIIKKVKENTFSQDVLDEVELSIVKALNEIQIANDELAYVENGWRFNDNEIAYENKRRKILDGFEKIRAREIKLNWFSFGGELSSQSYKFFDQLRATNDQIFKEDDLVPSICLSFSHFSNEINDNSIFLGKRRINFFTIGAIVEYGNNINALSKIEIEKIEPAGTNQSIISTQKAFIGTFEDDIVTSKMAIDYYHLGEFKNNMGFHLRGTLDIGPHAPVTSIRGGVVFSAIDKKNVKSTVNFEVFYGLNDIFKSEEENNLLSRNIIGIQTTVPFNYNF